MKTIAIYHSHGYVAAVPLAEGKSKFLPKEEEENM